MSAYTSRRLPLEEWPKLAAIYPEVVWQHLDPEETQVIVVEQADQIVGVWLAVRCVHAEGVWIAPAHRGTFGVVTRLLSGMRAAAKSWGASVVWTGAAEGDTSVTNLITRLGGSPIPMTAYRLPMGGA